MAVALKEIRPAFCALNFSSFAIIVILMGNLPPSSSSPSSSSSVSSPAGPSPSPRLPRAAAVATTTTGAVAADDDDDYDEAADRAVGVLESTFERTVLGERVGGKVIDIRLLLPKVFSKLQEKYPAYLAAASYEAQAEAVPPPSMKFPRTSLQGQPVEVLATIAKYLTRKSFNDFGETCTRIHGVVINTSLMGGEPPWPTRRPYHDLLRPAIVIDVPPLVFFSNCGSRAVVAREGSAVNFRSGKRQLQVWDRSMGLLEVDGELRCYPPYFVIKPIFSPDGRLLILEPRYGAFRECGIRVCQLPGREHTVPITVSSHLSGAVVCGITFLDNDTICFRDCKFPGSLRRCKINRNNNQISFEEPDTIYEDNDPGLSLLVGFLCSFSSERKDILAFSRTDGSVIFYDLRRNLKKTFRPIPLTGTPWVRDLALSPDGKRLVVARRGCLSVFDCNVERIEDIGEPKVLFHLPGFEYIHISWSPFNSSRVAVGCVDETCCFFVIAKRHRVVDIETEEVLSDGVVENDSWRFLVGADA